MKKELNTKARIAAFGGGSASDTPKADSRAPMAPPSSNRGGTEIEDAGAFQEAFECYETYILDGKGNLLGVPLRRGVSDSAFIDQPPLGGCVLKHGYSLPLQAALISCL